LLPTGGRVNPPSSDPIASQYHSGGIEAGTAGRCGILRHRQLYAPGRRRAAGIRLPVQFV